jgi:hypothetical protein
MRSRNRKDNKSSAFLFLASSARGMVWDVAAGSCLLMQNPGISSQVAASQIAHSATSYWTNAM